MAGIPIHMAQVPHRLAAGGVVAGNRIGWTAAILITKRNQSSSNIFGLTRPNESKGSMSYLFRTPATSYNQITVSTASRWAK